MAELDTPLGFLEYVHTIDSFSKGVDQSGPFYRVQYHINNYSDTNIFIGTLTGEVTQSGGLGGSTARVAPHRHPLAPLLSCASATLVEPLGEPVLSADGYPDYDGGALIQAEYRATSLEFGPAVNLLNGFDPDTPILWATQELDFGSETYTIDRGDFKYVGGPLDGEPTGVAAKISIPITTMVLTFHKLPYMPMGAVRSRIGKVNDAVFLGAEAGCVLFKGAKTTREFNTDGSIVQKVQLVFEERTALHKWNWLPNRKKFTWYEVKDSDNERMYKATSLTALVRF